MTDGRIGKKRAYEKFRERDQRRNRARYEAKKKQKEADRG